MRSRPSLSAALGGAAILALAAAAASAPSCVKKPRPRTIAGNVTTPEGHGQGRGGTQEGRLANDGAGDSGDPGSNATAGHGDDSTATAEAAETAVANATATATAATTATAVAGEPKPAVADPAITLRAVYSGGYFKNCVFLRPISGGAWTRMGCTKKEATSTGACVGLDPNFRAALKVAPAAKGANRFEIRIDTVHQTKVCADNTFVYDAGGTKIESNPNPASGEGRKRFKCGRKDLGGVQRTKICFEDSTNANFKDLILLFDAKGDARFEIEGIEPKCVDDVKPEIENDC